MRPLAQRLGDGAVRSGETAGHAADKLSNYNQRTGRRPRLASPIDEDWRARLRSLRPRSLDTQSDPFHLVFAVQFHFL
jgi:hypothetical protein